MNTKNKSELLFENRSPNIKELVSVFGTFILVSIAWVFFRADSFETAFLALRQMTVLDFSILPAVLVSYVEFLSLNIYPFYMAVICQSG